jgi:threonine dehydratase
MQDVFDAFAGSAHRRGVAQICLPEVDPAQKPLKVRSLSGQVIIDSANFVPTFYQGSRQGGANETSDSRN